MTTAQRNEEDRGDISLRRLWLGRGNDCIVHARRIADVDAKSNRSKATCWQTFSNPCLNVRKRRNAACLKQRRHFSSFVARAMDGLLLGREAKKVVIPSKVSAAADGLLGREAKTSLKKLSALPAEKWEKPHSQACGHANVQTIIAIARATHPCLH
jgi:hypothetical protein